MENNMKDLAIIETIKEAREIQKKLEMGNVKPTIGQYNKIIKLQNEADRNLNSLYSPSIDMTKPPTQKRPNIVKPQFMMNSSISDRLAMYAPHNTAINTNTKRAVKNQ